LEPSTRLLCKTGSAKETFAKEMIVTRTRTKTLFIIKLHKQEALKAAQAAGCAAFRTHRLFIRCQEGKARHF
jgi:hypothetical protein